MPAREPLGRVLGFGGSRSKQGLVQFEDLVAFANGLGGLPQGSERLCRLQQLLALGELRRPRRVDPLQERLGPRGVAQLEIQDREIVEGGSGVGMIKPERIFPKSPARDR